MEQDVANRAVRNFNKMLPTLSGFAKALSGDPTIRVTMTNTNTSTDGKTIFVVPPLEAADISEHDRSLCDERDDIGRLLCAACARIESVYMRIFHELSHIINGSFEKLEKSKIRRMALQGALFSECEEYEEFVRNQCEKLSSEKTKARFVDPYEYSKKISPLIVNLLRVFDDVCIDKKMSTIRPGVGTMRFYQTEILLETGIHDTRTNGTPRKWKDQPLEAQLVIAILCHLHGHELAGRFAQEAIDVINHPEVQKCLHSVDLEESDIADCIRISSYMLGVLIKLEIFELPDSQDQSDKKDKDKSQTVIGSGGDSDPSSQDDQNCGDSQSVDMDDLIDQILGHQEHGEEDDLSVDDKEKIANAILQSLWWRDNSEMVDGIRIDPEEGGLIYRGNPGVRKSKIPLHAPVDRTTLSPAILHGRRVFSDSRMDKNVRGLRRGKLDARSLGRRAWNDDDRLFKKKIRAEGIDYHVVIGVDVSYSTMQNHAIGNMRRVAQAIGDTLSVVDVDFEMWAHTTTRARDAVGFFQVMTPIKRVGHSWSDIHRNRISTLMPSYGSLDGHNMEFYRRLLTSSRAKKKLLVYFTDGQIPETNNVEERAIMKREAEIFRKLGLHVLIVAIHIELKNSYGFDHVLVSNPEDIATVIKEVERRVTR